MNRRTADRIRHLSKELLGEQDEKRILELAAELRAELRNHIKHLRDRLAVTEIRERRLRNGSTYDEDVTSEGLKEIPPEDPSQSIMVDEDRKPPPAAPKPAVEPQVQAKNDSEGANNKNDETGIKAN